MANRDTELRKKWWTRPLGHLLWLLITLVCATLRKRVVNTKPGDDSFGKQQFIIALWHNRTFVPCYFYKYVIRGKVPMSMLTSASKDGAMLATVAEDYGMRAVRGSSSRRGVAGFLDMMREVQAGYCMCITPDGPRGPIYRCHPGVIKLASLSGVPIRPINISFSSCWRIGKAWDGFIIPKPFSRVTLQYGEVIRVPRELDDAGRRAYCEKLEQALACGEPDFTPITQA